MYAVVTLSIVPEFRVLLLFFCQYVNVKIKLYLFL